MAQLVQYHAAKDGEYQQNRTGSRRQTTPGRNRTKRDQQRENQERPMNEYADTGKISKLPSSRHASIAC